MNRRYYIGLLETSGIYHNYGQDTFDNISTIQMHTDSETGFHTNLANDRTYDQNLGFTGFSNPKDALIVSGDNRPIFNDVEIDVAGDLYVAVTVGVSNFREFVNGSLITATATVSNAASEFVVDYISGATTVITNRIITYKVNKN